ncbi:hypothetical protein SZMC14600_19469 [Saccharomonospora azurea SZMC 14600]|uniref:hypothetical protein n=1 Tax=Saccharomonospora azurea TaxID=40988 RepID=UPI00023FEE1B
MPEPERDNPPRRAMPEAERPRGVWRRIPTVLRGARCRIPTAHRAMRRANTKFRRVTDASTGTCSTTGR